MRDQSGSRRPDDGAMDRAFDSAAVRFTVLGPVRAWLGEVELPLGPPKQQAVLALLLTQAGRPVPLYEIVDVLWGGDPPNSAVNVVHRHVGALRRLLEPELRTRADARRLLRGSGGYRLNVDPDAVDLLRFRALRGEARSAAADGDPERAATLLVAALSLWRGPTAAGLPPVVRAHPAFAAVDGEYTAAAKEAADTALTAGHAEYVLAALRKAAALEPLDEGLQARLVTVLSAAGQQAQALDHYRTVRARLTAELGLDPGPELRAAQQRVLRQTASAGPGGSAPRTDTDTEIDVGVGAGAGPEAGTGAGAGTNTNTNTGTGTGTGTGTEASTARVRPAQLPPDLAVFTGRDAELARAQALLPEDGSASPAVVISAIGGAPGVGKTTLAVHWAHQVAPRFPDGQLYVNLRGYDPGESVMRPAEAIRSFLDAFGVPPGRVPASLDAQTALYRSLLADRRVLVLLDNARDAEQVRPLLPAAPGCLAIVTSRHQLPGLMASDGARPLRLDLLTADESLDFLVRRLGEERVAAEPDAAGHIVELCGRLPLALAVVCARAAVHPHFSLASVAEELRQSHGSLDAFDAGDPTTDPRSVFSWSYRTLTPAAARLFRLLSLCPGPDVSLGAAASLAGLAVRAVRPVLAELARAHLCSEHVLGRYASHDLLRAYSRELAQADDPRQELTAARRRLLDHYLHSAYAACTLLAPQREQITLPPPVAGAEAVEFDDHDRAHAWLTTELTVLQAVIESDAASGSGAYAWRLASTLEHFLDRLGRRQEQLALQSTALTAARRLGDPTGQAHTHRALGLAHGRLERHDEARTHLLRARELFAEIRDPPGEGRTERYLAFLANMRGAYREALDHYVRADSLYASAGHRGGGRAAIANEVGWTHILLGEPREALDECRRAVRLARQSGNRNVEAAAWDSIGVAHHRLGQRERALEAFGHALDQYREISDAYLTADTLVHIGDAHAAAGAGPAAQAAWQEALGILEAVGHPEAGDVRARLRRTAGRPAGRPAGS
ncbi:BTAD domain-containing putative transcriptional regulator [Streptomyces sp. NPDC002018]|uniref:AfsR/SARP family transcriptional regulator n=1 Tax=Streptomyces sp. NPDC002018 TaxID=3364629 RepID=UPI0036A1753E